MNNRELFAKTKIKWYKKSELYLKIETGQSSKIKFKVILALMKKLKVKDQLKWKVLKLIKNKKICHQIIVQIKANKLTNNSKMWLIKMK